MVTKIWRSPRRSTCAGVGGDDDDEGADVRSNDIDVTEIVGHRFDRNGIEYMGLSGAQRQGGVGGAPMLVMLLLLSALAPQFYRS